jgi:pimeloyl-ACP methyl ester carboxylesterase
MTSADESTMTKVTSTDGTEIAYWWSGTGPPLVVVHGIAADHTRWRPLLSYLDPYVTVHAMDRRGRGASGDGPEYSLAREFEDVAAVVDAVADASDTKVDLYGHSHGGFCAFGAAALTPNVRRLVLYEGWPLPDPTAHALPHTVEERLDALLASGDREAVVEAVFRDLLDMSDDELDAFRAAPSWQGRVAAAHTITRECRAEAEARLDPDQAGKITMPVLLVTGADSTDPSRKGIAAVVEALPDARILELESQDHVADATAPEVFAGHVLAFLGEAGGATS